MKIVQIAEHDGGLVGLAEDGKLYSMINKNLGFGLHKPTWELYCTEYGVGLTKSVIDQVTDFITGQCYTSTKVSEKLRDYYGAGVVFKRVDDKVVMTSNDRRVTVTVESCKVPVEDNSQVTVCNGFKITVVNSIGDTQMQLVANKSGGSYVRV